MRPPSGEGPWFWFVVRSGEVLVVDGPDGPRIPTGPVPPITLADDALIVLGTLEGAHAWGAGVERDTEATEGHRWLHLRQLHGQVPDVHWTVAGRAEQLASWDRDHRFCGRCGERTERHATERARQCPGCGSLAFPRLSPATIMRITRGEHDEEILLAHGRQFPGRFFSVLAGFVEPGETLEECVAREVLEETGITVTDIAYFGSQPWPFPHQLMVGFTARWASGELVIQEEEIVEAGWYRADDLPPCPRGGMSISGWLIDDWLTAQEARAAS
jgi:NAD+ diphosphatase